MWAQDRFEHVAAFLAEARNCGFTHIEAHSSLSLQMLNELLEAPISISSIHSPCPTFLSPKGIPIASPLLSSILENKRREAIDSAKKTIDIASRVGAKAVIVHMGEVSVNAELEKTLHRRYNEGLFGSEIYMRVKEQLISERASKAPLYLEKARESLDELSKYSKAQGITLGLENRFHYYEIPSINEMENLLNGVKGNSVGYWHDVGHAEVQQHLGFTPHEKWLQRFSNRMIGIHLHDVIGLSDHRVPGKGNINWSLITKYLPQSAIRTCEINHCNWKELIQGILPFLQRIGIIVAGS
jgi:sugar phosphate isomerase/epimerase